MALTFDGATQYARNAAAVLAAMPLTMACWVNPSSVTSNSIPIMSIDDGAAAAALDAWSIRRDTSTLRAISIAAGTATGPSIGAALAIGTWAHACAVFTSATARAIYVNGGGKVTSATSNNPATPSQTIIANQGDLSTFFAGDIAEAAIWNVALTDDEVAALGASCASPLMIRPASLVAYWPLIGRNSPAIGPKGGFNLTLTGAPVAAPHCRIRYPKPPSFDRSYLP